jgi:asparagine synthetase B (glutamine-hydrolysing)
LVLPKNQRKPHLVKPSEIKPGQSETVGHNSYFEFPYPTLPCEVINLHTLFQNQTQYSAKSADNTLHLFLIGTIYNDEFGSEKTAERLLQTYRQKGKLLFAELNGNFVLVISDLQNQELLLIADRTASKALFYTTVANRLAFSDEIMPLARLIGHNATINVTGVASFLANGFILDGETLLNDINLLGPGQYLCVNQQGVQKRVYWQFAYAEERDQRPIESLESELYDRMLKAVDRRIHSGDSYGLMLSGGYDSRALLGCLLALKPDDPLITVTWGENENQPHSDVAIAASLAARFKTNHNFFRLDPRPFTDSFLQYIRLSEGRTDAIGNYPNGLKLFESTRRDLGVQFLLRGDEWFGGSGNVMGESQALHRLSIHRLDRLGEAYPYLNPNIHRHLIEVNREQFSRLSASCPYTELHDRKDYYCYNQHLFAYLNPLTQLKEHAVGICTPHLDNDVLDFMLTVPTKYRLDKELFRRTVKQTMPNLWTIPFARTSSQIDWNLQIHEDSNLQAFIWQMLVKEQNNFDILINHRKLAYYLERTFSKPRRIFSTVMQRARKKVIHRRDRFELDHATEIFRLMILKSFFNEFYQGNISFIPG